MAAAPPDAGVRTDRRHRRREETIGQVIDVAVELMGEQGAAGLSLGEVARRIGIRTPSLYVYFDSKLALYDAVFERGWRLLQQWLSEVPDLPATDDDLPPYVLTFAAAFARWATEHGAYGQLMFWRPVPGFEPSAQAYAPAVEVLADCRERMSRLRDRGVLRPDVDIDEALRVFTILIAGTVSQQLANAPAESFDEGPFTLQLPTLVAMFLGHYGEGHDGSRHAPPDTRRGLSADRPSRRREPHAGKRRSDR